MCGILGLFHPCQDISNKQKEMQEMLALLKKRGPDDENIFISEHCILGHRRLSIIDLEGGKQPFCYTHLNKEYWISYNGEIYNMNELKQQLIDDGYHFYSQSDTEVILISYIAYGKKCVEYLDGIFSFIIYHENNVFVARDHLGVKPLFYLYKDHELLVASEIKCILKYLKKAVVTDNGIKELLGLGPSVTPGKTIYKDIHSLAPGHYLCANELGISITCYFQLEKRTHPHSYQETIRHVRHLVNKSIHQQLLSDVPISCMLSGGLDSSIICALASQYNNNLATYSVDYQQQAEHFQAYAYQTSRDEDYIQAMIDRYQNKHTSITLSQEDLVNSLEEALVARDMPGMADIDSSFLLFCKEIGKNHKVVLSGECADEIFGGYPWFYQNQDCFPWIRDIENRNELYSDYVKQLDIPLYVKDSYQYSSYIHHNSSDSSLDAPKRKMIHLHYQWFMQTLLTRADSQSMRASIEQRVPFASKEIIQYMYNVPTSYMYHNGVEKSLLREAFKDLLPESIYGRKKNPYPKTHHPKYTQYIQDLLLQSLQEKENILYKLFDIKKLKEVITDPSSFKTPWFGQLMTGPQLLAYFYQIYLWGKIYQIQIENN